MEDSKYASRKFIMLSAALLISTALVWLRVPGYKDWLDFAWKVIGIYCGANLGIYAVDKIFNKNSEVK